MSTLGVFEIKDGVLTAYRGGEAAVAVPAGVTAIAKGVFAGCGSIRSLTLPHGLLHVGPEAFCGCENLGNVSFPDTLQTLGRRAFANCTQLSAAVLPEGVTRIAEETFSGCVRMRVLELPRSLAQVEARAFYNCSGLETVPLPPSVKSIGKSAFEGCRRLYTLYVPAGVTAIEEKTFYLCESLVDAHLPQTLRRIENAAFAYCRVLQAGNLPPLLTHVGSTAFAYTGLFFVQLPAGLKTVGDRAFYGADNLNSVHFLGDPDAVSIGSEAFCRCPKLAGKNGMYILQGRLFSYYSYDTPARTVVPESVKYIERSAFADVDEVHVEMPLKCPAWDTLGTAESFGFGASILHAPGSTISFRDTNGRIAAKVITATQDEAIRTQYTVYLSVRQKDGCFDFAAYDGVFGLLAGKRNRLLTALTRLKYPYMLAPEKRQEYLDFLKHNDEAAGTVLIEEEDIETLSALCAENVFSPAAVQRLTAFSAERQQTQITALLLDYRARHGGGRSGESGLFSLPELGLSLKDDGPNGEYKLSKAAGTALFRIRSRGKEGVITAYTGKEETLTLPEKIGGTFITALGEQAFQGAPAGALRALTVPGWYARFAPNAFCCLNNCSVRFCEGITCLPPGLFSLARNLTVRLPRSLSTLGEQDLFSEECGNTGNVFLVPEDSVAQQLCEENGWPYQICSAAPDALDAYAQTVLKKLEKTRGRGKSAQIT